MVPIRAVMSIKSIIRNLNKNGGGFVSGCDYNNMQRWNHSDCDVIDDGDIASVASRNLFVNFFLMSAMPALISVKPGLDLQAQTSQKSGMPLGKNR